MTRIRVRHRGNHKYGMICGKASFYIFSPTLCPKNRAGPVRSRLDDPVSITLSIFSVSIVRSLRFYGYVRGKSPPDFQIFSKFRDILDGKA